MPTGTRQSKTCRLSRDKVAWPSGQGLLPARLAGISVAALKEVHAVESGVAIGEVRAAMSAPGFAASEGRPGDRPRQLVGVLGQLLEPGRIAIGACVAPHRVAGFDGRRLEAPPRVVGLAILRSGAGG